MLFQQGINFLVKRDKEAAEHFEGYNSCGSFRNLTRLKEKCEQVGV
jgi:hypothetical protein